MEQEKRRKKEKYGQDLQSKERVRRVGKEQGRSLRKIKNEGLR